MDRNFRTFLILSLAMLLLFMGLQKMFLPNPPGGAADRAAAEADGAGSENEVGEKPAGEKAGEAKTAEGKAGEGKAGEGNESLKRPQIPTA